MREHSSTRNADQPFEKALLGFEGSLPHIEGFDSHLISAKTNSSKFKFVELVWNLDDHIVLIFLNLAQFISHKTNSV